VESDAMSDLPTPHFSGSRSELEALEEWVDQFTRASTSPASDESGEVTYLVDLGKLNTVLATAHDYFGCLDPVAAQECSELVRSLQREVTALLAPGDGILGLDIDEQAYERCQRQLKRTIPFFQRLGVRIRAAISKLSDAPLVVEPTNRMSWKDVSMKLLKIMNDGERFSSHSKMAEKIGCSSATVHKAIRRTTELSQWSEKQHGSATGMLPLDGIVTDNIAQSREADPSDSVEPLDIDKAMQYLIENSGTDELAKINAMTPAERRQLAETAYRDPDRTDQIFRHRKKGRNG